MKPGTIITPPSPGDLVTPPWEQDEKTLAAKFWAKVIVREVNEKFAELKKKRTIKPIEQK